MPGAGCDSKLFQWRDSTSLLAMRTNHTLILWIDSSYRNVLSCEEASYDRIKCGGRAISYCSSFAMGTKGCDRLFYWIIIPHSRWVVIQCVLVIVQQGNAN